MGRGGARFRNGGEFVVSGAVREFEQRVADSSVERAAVFDADGTLVGEFGGIVADNVTVPSTIDLTNRMLTHNHPPDDNGLGTLDPDHAAPSSADLFNSVERNALGVRAVTPTTTFTITRGRTGWGGSVADYERAYDAAREQVQGAVRRRYARAAGLSDEEVPDFAEARRDPAVARRFRAAGSATMTRDIVTTLATQFGFSFTATPRRR